MWRKARKALRLQCYLQRLQHEPDSEAFYTDQHGELQNVTISISAKTTLCVHIAIKSGLTYSIFPATF